MITLSNIEQNLCELYEITWYGGAVSYFTTYHKALTYNAHTWQSIPLKRDAIQYHADLQSDGVNVTFGIVGLQIGTDNLTVPQIIQRDWHRNAHLKIYLVDYMQLDDSKLLFEGWCNGGVSYDAGSVSMEFGSVLDKLNEKFPRLIYSEQCQHRVFDAYCGLTKATYASTGVVSTGSTSNIVNSTVFNFSTAHPSGWWVKGEISFTAGVNNGVSRSIEAHYDGYVRTMTPLPLNPTTADHFTAYPGCDRTGPTCETKFDNYDNFFGFEHIPKPETLVYA